MTKGKEDVHDANLCVHKDKKTQESIVFVFVCHTRKKYMKLLLFQVQNLEMLQVVFLGLILDVSTSSAASLNPHDMGNYVFVADIVSYIDTKIAI